MKFLKHIFIGGLIVGVLGIYPNFAMAALSTGLAGYWKQDESSGNAADSSGNSNTLVNTGVVYSAGKINNGALFTKAGTGDKLEIADASQTGLGITGDISVSAWVKLNSTPATDYILMSKWNPGANQRSYQMFYAPGTIYFSIGSGSGSESYSVSQTLSNSTWYYITFTWTAASSQGRWYVNGSLVASPTGVLTSIYSGSAPFTLGNYTSSTAEDFDGTLDEVGIRSRELTGAEVTSLYNAGAGCQHSFATCESAPSSIISDFFWFE